MKTKKMKLNQRERILVEKFREMERSTGYDGGRDFGMVTMTYICARPETKLEGSTTDVYGVVTHPHCGMLNEPAPPAVEMALLKAMGENMAIGAKVFLEQHEAKCAEVGSEVETMEYPVGTSDEEIRASGEAMLARLEGKSTH